MVCNLCDGGNYVAEVLEFPKAVLLEPFEHQSQVAKGGGSRYTLAKLWRNPAGTSVSSDSCSPRAIHVL